MSKLFTIAEGLENMGAIKSGGQGSVYKGRRIGEIITAIKLLPTPIFSQSEEDKHYRDFSNEVKKLQRVNEEPNPNIVKILSYGVTETGCFPYIEMEYIDGPDLGELLKPPHPPVFPIKEIARVAYQLSHALAHCHKLDVKHGDIKSNNVKYNQHTGNYVLIDFGLAIHSDEERRSSMRHAGAIEFMAPEQNEGQLRFETDVYSFGIVLYELLAGRVPFPLDGNSETARNKVMVAHMETSPPDALALRAANTPAGWSEEQRQAEMQVPEWLLTTIYKCLQKRPEDRFADGAELHDYITHHRLYTTEVANFVKKGDDRWQQVLADKDRELESLRAQVNRNTQQAVPAYRETVAVDRGPSKNAFRLVLLLLLLMSGLAVYGLFFNKPVVSGASTALETPVVDSSGSAGVGTRVSENSNAAKANEKLSSKRKKQVADSLARVSNTQSQQTRTDSTDEEQVARTLAEEVEKSETPKEDDERDGASAAGTRYKVRGKAYFHNEPDAATQRKAFIVHWNNAVLTPLDEKNGFIYVVFTNHLGQTSKGWLSKADLVAVK